MSDSRYFAGIFQFIQKNTVIPAYLSTIDENALELNQLLAAIERGDAEDAIFNHQHCYLYLLKLLQFNKISITQSMTVYAYLLALMQFTNRQALKKDDQDVKSLRMVAVDVCVEKGVLTESAQSYFYSIQKSFKKIGCYIKKSEFEKYILQLPPNEQWLIRVHNKELEHFSLFHQGRKNLYSAEYFKNALLPSLPFAAMTPKGASVSQCQAAYWMPSFSIIEYLLKRLSSDCLQMQPVFGCVSIDTISKWHQKGVHFVSWYGEHVISNPASADHYKCGPFLMMLHDVGHACWGSMLTQCERDYLYDRVLPFLDKVLQRAKVFSDEAAASKLTEMQEELTDFNLTPINKYSDQAFRLRNYLSHLHPRKVGINKQAKLGENLEDRLYVLFYQVLKDDAYVDDDRQLLSLLAPHIKAKEWRMDEDRAHALLALTDQFQSTQSRKIDWDAWRFLVDTHEDSGALWKAVQQERYDELLVLIIDYGLKFFHPIIPLTEVRRLEFREFILDQIAAQSNCFPFSF